MLEAVVHPAVAAEQFDQFLLLAVGHRAAVLVDLLLLGQPPIGALLLDVLVHVDVRLVAEFERDRLRAYWTDRHLMIMIGRLRAVVPVVAVVVLAEDQRAGIALDR